MPSVVVGGAVLVAAHAYAQAPTRRPNRPSYGFRSGNVFFGEQPAQSCGGAADPPYDRLEYRYAATDSWTLHRARAAGTPNCSLQTESVCDVDLDPGDTVAAIANRPWVQVRMSSTADSVCGRGSAYTDVVTYIPIPTLTTNRFPLDETKLDGAQLRISAGNSHNFVNPLRTWHFELVATPAVSGLSIRSVSVGGPRNRPNSVATLTLAFDGDFTRNFALKVRVRPSGFNPTGGPNVDSHHSLTVKAHNDYDVDDDGLIEISTLAQLNAVRWDLDGDGNPSTANAEDYAAAFLTSGDTLGCPITDADADDHDCLGYELADHLDFDTDGDDDVDANDTGSYTNWTPIGGAYSGIFDGNGYTIGHLTHNGSGNFGLFDTVSGMVRNLGLPDVNVTSGTADYVSSLAVVVSGRVIGSWASGRIFNSIPSSTGGLVAQVSGGRVAASYSAVDITGASDAGGLAFSLSNGVIIASYAAGSVSGTAPSGFLYTSSQGRVQASYATGTVTDTSTDPAFRNPLCFIGGAFNTVWPNNYCDTISDPTFYRTTATLQAPTGPTGIYSAWANLDVDGDGVAGENPWHFGTASQYPVLLYGAQDQASSARTTTGTTTA